MTCEKCKAKLPDTRDDVLCLECRGRRIIERRCLRDAILPCRYPAIFSWHVAWAVEMKERF